MKLDARMLRYLTTEDFRVLTAVRALERDARALKTRATHMPAGPASLPFRSSQLEMGSKNHETVPTHLIGSLAGLRHGGYQKILGELVRLKLAAFEHSLHCTCGTRAGDEGEDRAGTRARTGRGRRAGTRTGTRTV